MKQQITYADLESLKDSQKKKLYDWMEKEPEKYDFDPLRFAMERYLMTIGQMIEFIYYHRVLRIQSEERESQWRGWYVNEKSQAVELVDALWMEVKELLK